MAVMSLLCCFNSNMVRLKVDRTSSLIISIMFQFQYGSIKRSSKSIPVDFAHLFQFQYGSIKRYLQYLLRLRLSRFNSNMVRLKAFCLNVDAKLKFSFNSNMVRLKELISNSSEDAITSFNSNMVRLKEYPMRRTP